MSNTKILVTGAAGKTGAPVVEQLLERGFAVRAMVRQRDDRSDRLERLGAEVVVGDFVDIASIREAMRNAKRAYFCYPPQGDRLVEATAIFAAAARDAGVEAIVNMSQLPAREDSSSPLSRHHWLSEKIFDRAGVGVVHIRPTFFSEMLLILGADTIASEGKLYMPYGDASHAPVAAADIARVVVGVLADPTPHLGERLIVTGPRDMTIDEMASVLSDELGKAVEYVDLPEEAWNGILVDHAGLPQFLATHLQAVAKDHKNGLFSAETDVVERVGGRPPQSLASFVREHREQFEGAYEPAVVR